MNEVKNDYIKRALNELIPTLGVREFVDHEKLYPLVHSGKLKECIKQIALYLGLPVEIIIYSVSKGYRPNANDSFQSAHLVKTDEKKRGTGGITAQVSIPSNLPLYGSIGMVNFPISVRISENCAENAASFIAIMAHELSHIILYSILHREKESEFYTDLTAMMLGFANVMKIGRVATNITKQTQQYVFHSTTTTTTETTTYGYLSRENFYFAFDEIKSFLSKQVSAKYKLFEKLNQFKKKLSKTKKISFYFKNYLEYLDKNLNLKISQEDGHKISAFHQSGYADNFHSIIVKNETHLKNSLKFLENLKNYTAGNIETMQKYEAQLKLANEELAKQHFLLQKDVNVLKKYVGFFYRLKLNFT